MLTDINLYYAHFLFYNIYELYPLCKINVLLRSYTYAVNLVIAITASKTFFKSVSYAQNLSYLIKNTAKTAILWIITIKITFLFEYILNCNLFLRCKAEFSASLLQSSVSHDPSEIILYVYIYI